MAGCQHPLPHAKPHQIKTPSNSSPISPPTSAIARDTGYFSKSVQHTLNEMEDSGHMRLRLAPMKKVARMLRGHEDLLLNYFRAKRQYTSVGMEPGLWPSRVPSRFPTPLRISKDPAQPDQDV